MMITSSQIARLEKLTELRDKGALTPEEFEQHKQAILSPPTTKSPGAQLPSFVKERSAVSADLAQLEMHLRWTLLPLKKYANFTGRSGRREYWMFMLGIAAVYTILFASLPAEYEPGFDGTLGLIFLFSAGMFLPLLAVQVRRLHDQEKPGWWVLLNLIPYAGAVVLLILMCLEGTDGPNRYGDDPDTI